MEHRVGGERPSGVDAGLAQRGDRRRDDVDVLAAEPAGFAGVRVEPGNDDDRSGDREIAAQRGIDNTPRMDDYLARQCRDRLAQREVDRHRYDAQIAARQHHHRRIMGPGQLGEVFGMPGMAESGAIECILVDRVGDERGGPARAHIGNGGVDRVQHQRLVRRLRMTGPRGRRLAERHHRQRVREHVGRCSAAVDRLHRHVPAQASRPIAQADPGSSIR